MAKGCLRTAKALRRFPELTGPAQELVDLANAANRPLTIALMGPFKTGKSTLLNALIGEELLVADSTPATAIQTAVRFGRKRRLIARYQDGSARRLPMSTLRAISTVGEGHSAEKRKGLVSLEALLPHPRLRQMTFIDTPGLHSGVSSHAAAAHAAFADVDAVLWVLSFTQAGTSAEGEEFARLPARLTPLAVVNQIDLHDPEEEDLTATLANIRRRLGDRIAGMAALSARQALHAIDRRNESLLTASGLPATIALIKQHTHAQATRLRAARLSERLEAILAFIEDVLVQGQADGREAREKEHLAENFDSVTAERKRALGRTSGDWETAGSSASFVNSVQELGSLPSCIPAFEEMNRELAQTKADSQQLLSDIGRLNAEVDPVASYARLLGVPCAAVTVDPSGQMSSASTDGPGESGPPLPGRGSSRARELERYGLELGDRATDITDRVKAFHARCEKLHRRVRSAVTRASQKIAKAEADKEATIASLRKDVERGLWGERAAWLLHNVCVPALAPGVDGLKALLPPGDCAVAPRLIRITTASARLASPRQSRSPRATPVTGGSRRWARCLRLGAAGAVAAMVFTLVPEADRRVSQTPVAVPATSLKVLEALQTANVRAGPSMDHNVIAVLQEGQSVVATDYVSGWAEVQYAPDKSGWVWRELLSETPATSQSASETLGAGSEALED